MKIEVCDNMVIVDGVPHVLMRNDTGQDRIRQTIEIGPEMKAAQPAPQPAPPPPPPPPAPEASSEEGGPEAGEGEGDAE